MIPIHHLEGQRIAVFGLGRSGLSFAQAAKAGGANVFVYDGNQDAVEKAEQQGFEYRNLARDREWDGIDLLIMSPGIPTLYPRLNPIYEMALRKNIPVDNDISLFFKELRETYYDLEIEPRVIAITGSNGKSTTTALIHHALKDMGFAAQMGGNIGRGVFDLDPPQSGEIYVLELSSYQTEMALELTPDIAVLTNISPDHLDRHGGMGGYFAAKTRLFTNALPRAVIGIDEAEGLSLETRLHALGARVNAVSIKAKPENRAHFYHVKKGFLSEWRKGKQAANIDLRPWVQLPGAHNWQNIACAFGALRALNLAPHRIAKAFESFGGLPHRSQRVGEFQGITVINDSKATNAEATKAALEAFENIHWIAGGVAKEGGISSLAPYFDKIKTSYLIGEAAEDFAQTLQGHDVILSGTLENALLDAHRRAQSGDVILLSPACASFDQFADFEARGEAFIILAKKIFQA